MGLGMSGKISGLPRVCAGAKTAGVLKVKMRP